MTSRRTTLEEVETWDGPPLVLFVGVSTGGSLAHAVFGGWAGAFDQSWLLRGIDLPVDTHHRSTGGCSPPCVATRWFGVRW